MVAKKSEWVERRSIKLLLFLICERHPLIFSLSFCTFFFHVVQLLLWASFHCTFYLQNRNDVLHSTHIQKLEKNVLLLLLLLLLHRVGQKMLCVSEWVDGCVLVYQDYILLLFAYSCCLNGQVFFYAYYFICCLIPIITITRQYDFSQ